MKRIFAAFLVLGIMLGTGSCSMKKVKEIEVISADIKSFKLSSSRSADAIILLEIDNPAGKFTVNDLEATVKLKGKEMGIVRASKIPLEAKCRKIYEVPCSAALADGVSVLSVLPILDGGSFESVTADVSLYVSLGRKSRGKHLVKNDIPLSKLIK